MEETHRETEGAEESFLIRGSETIRRSSRLNGSGRSSERGWHPHKNQKRRSWALVMLTLQSLLYRKVCVTLLRRNPRTSLSRLVGRQAAGLARLGSFFLVTFLAELPDLWLLLKPVTQHAEISEGRESLSGAN